MQKLRPIGVLALVGLFAACIFWMLGDGDIAAPGAPRSGEAVAAAAAGAGLSVVAGGAADAAGDVNSRVAVEADASRGAGGNGTDAAEAALFGRVVDEAGAPLAGAAVIVTPMQSYDPRDFEGGEYEAYDPAKQAERMHDLLQLRIETATDADGRFRLVPRGTSRHVELRVLARGYQVQRQNPQRPTEVDVDVGTLTLKRGATASGRVVDGNGRGIANATVDRRSKGDSQDWGDFEYFGYQQVAGQRPGEECVTDRDGRFELQHLPPGEFWLRARHVDHPMAQLDNLRVAAGKDLTDLRIVAETGASIRGRVVDLPKEPQDLVVLSTSRPPGQENEEQYQRGNDQYGPGGPSYGERSAVVAADGSFTLRGLHQDRAYHVWAVQSNGGGANSAPCSPVAEVSAGVQGVELRYEAGVEVTARLVDSKTGKPIEVLWVRHQLRGGQEGMYWGDPSAARSRRYPEGILRIGNLRPKAKQTMSLNIDAVGYIHFGRDKIAMPLAGTLDLGVLRLDPMPAVDVEVVAAAGGAPVEGANVALQPYREGNQQYGGFQPGPHSGRTDADGRCRLNGMPGKKVVITVDDKEFARFGSEPITLPEKDDFSFKAQLVRGGSVEVMVDTADGDPVANAHVEHRDPGDRYDSRTTDAGGKVVFERQSPGPHRFRLSRRDDPGNLAVQRPSRGNDAKDASWSEVEVEDGRTAQVTLGKQPTASITGIVRQNGMPLANARVTFLRGTDGFEMTPEMQFEMMRQMEGNGGGGRTDEQGRYELKEVAPGEHRLRVTHRDRAMAAMVPASLRIGPNSRDIDLETTTLRGTVRDPDGKPVSGATVSVAVADQDSAENRMPNFGDGQGNRARTGADGRYELRGVLSGVTLVARAQGKGFAPGTSAPVEVAAGGTRDDLDVQLLPAGRIHVTRAVEAGFAFVSAQCVDGPGKGSSASWERMTKEGATLDGLAPGRWKVRIHTGEQEVEPKIVDVAAGQTVELRL